MSVATEHYVYGIAIEHITPGDVAVLERITTGPRQMPFCAMRGPYGFWVWIGERDNDPYFREAGLSDAFLAVAAFVRTKGCDWVSLDHEYEVDPDDQLVSYPRPDPLGEPSPIATAMSACRLLRDAYYGPGANHEHVDWEAIQVALDEACKALGLPNEPPEEPADDQG